LVVAVVVVVVAVAVVGVWGCVEEVAVDVALAVAFVLVVVAVVVVRRLPACLPPLLLFARVPSSCGGAG
jgi:hypothetical protein